MLFHYDYGRIFYFFILKKHEYDVFEFLTKLIVLDFNENKFTIGVEILQASTVLNTKKYLIKNIENGEIAIKISEDKIELRLSLTIPVHQKATTLPISVIGTNKSQIPSVQTEVVIASA